MTVARLLAYLAYTRKFLVALVTAAGIIVSMGVLSGTAQAWVVNSIAVLGAFGVRQTRNADKPMPKSPKPDSKDSVPSPPA